MSILKKIFLLSTLFIYLSTLSFAGAQSEIPAPSSTTQQNQPIPFQPTVTEFWTGNGGRGIANDHY